MTKKILCIGSSIDLPRKGVLYSDTWISLLRVAYLGKDIEVVNRSLWAQTSKILVEPQQLEFIKPDITIINLGIVDSAPRKIFEKYLLHRGIEKLLFKYTLWFIFPYRLKGAAFVSIKDFEYNLKNYFDRFYRCAGKNGIIIVCKIGIPNYTMILKNKKIKENVTAYNKCLEPLCSKYDYVKLIDPLYDATNKNLYLPDGYHINVIGHYEFFVAIKKELKKYFNDEK